MHGNLEKEGEVIKLQIRAVKFPKNEPPAVTVEAELLARVYRRLFKEKKSPGKIFLFVVKFGLTPRLLGAFSENLGGSISFFPDFSDKLVKQHTEKRGKLITEEARPFDHLTLNRDFSKRGHFTDQKGKHFQIHDPAEIDSENGHVWFTVTCSNEKRLNEMPEEIAKSFPISGDLPPIIESLNASYKGIVELEFPIECPPGSFNCIQVALIEKGAGIPGKFLEGPLMTEMFEGVESQSNVSAYNFIFETTSGFGKDVVFRTFAVKGRPKDDLLLVLSTLNSQNPGH